MNPTLSTADLERILQMARAASPERVAPRPAAIPRAGRDGPLPLSFAQQRLWFLEQLGGLGSTYHVPMRLRLRGELDRAALGRALDRIVARHESLRTTFAQVDGVPEQRIAPADAGFPLAEHDLGGAAEAEVSRVMAQEAGAPFDLERGPLFRGRLLRLAGDEHVLLLTMHHIVSDGWSRGVLTRELGALYKAFRRGDPDPLPALEIQYADFAAWQRRQVEGNVLQEQADYWTRTLGDAPELLELPTDRPRPAHRDPAGAVLELELDAELTAGLRALSRRHGTTLFMTLLAGWAVVLGRLSGQADVVVGSPMAGRGRREIEGLIGFFVNTLALRVDLGGAPTVAELLARVRERTLAAQQHQDIPFEQVVERVAPARSWSHTPLFQVLFAWQNTPGESGQTLSGLRMESLAARASEAQAKFDLSLSMREVDDRIVGGVSYAVALWERETVARWAGYLRRVLAEMVADDGQRVERLVLLCADERARVLREWNRTDAELASASTVHALFEQQAERAPGATAVVFNSAKLSYAELNVRANRLAHHLRGLGVGPDVRVALCVERGLEMVIAVLAVLKAGGAYVPLDPAYPVDRLAYMLADSAPAVVLTQGHLRGRAADAGVPVLELDTPAPAWVDAPAGNPAVAGLTPEHLAYIIYTSGSTGRPKGVAIAHRNTVNLLDWAVTAFGRAGLERTLFCTSLNFDLAVFELFAPLAQGGSVWVVDDAMALLRSSADVALVNTVPSAMRALLDGGGLPAGVRTVNLAGEPLKQDLVERIFAETGVERVCNLYGPSETTTYSTGVEMRRGDGFAPHIGTPLRNTRVYVLDGAMQPVPVGVAGELYIGGAGVARGYLGRAALTADRFVPDPFGGGAGARTYRTGDLARWRSDGTLEFLGRADHQVKVRGFRIELGEIEARLVAHVGVRAAVVLAREDGGDTRLVAYVVGDETAGADVLRAHLGQSLPAYMVPAAYVRLDALPLTPNGKLDRKALPAPEDGAFARRGYEAPVGETEEALAEIWGSVLRVERVGRRDSFFEVGGHSLLAVQVISRVRQALQVQVELGELFARPVLADFARALETASRAELLPIERASREGRLPLSFAQQRLWFLEQMGGLGGTYHIPLRRRLRGPLDRDALVRALDGIVARHEALRTTFAQVDGVPEQRIAPADTGFHLVEHDLGGRADADAELGRLMAEEAGAPFDLERGPLIRGRLVRLAVDDHVLLLTMHHVVSDGWSMGVFTEELSALYAAHVRGMEAELPALRVQYADYAAWQRRWVEGEVLQAQADYWTQTLGGAPELLELPTDHPRPAQKDHAGAWLGVELDEALTAGLKALSRRQGTTLYMTLLAGCAAVLGRLSGQDDVVIGTPTAGRGRREIEGLIGFFVNTLALRVDLSGSPTVAGLLGRVKERALAAQHHQDIPFEQVVDLVDPVRSLSHTPLFQVLFAWQNAPGSGLELSGLALAPLSPAGSAAQVTAKFDLSLALSERDGRIVGGVEYATSLFERDTVERWTGYLRRVLEEMVADEGRRVERLVLMPADERVQVVEEWSGTDAAYPGDSCVHELFEAQVERSPDATAVVFAGERLTYAELNARANRLAHHLRSLGVGPEVRVALVMARSPELVEAELAVLKCGGVYVPLDPEHPDERLREVLADSAPAALLTTGELAERFAGLSVPVLALDAQSAAWASRPATNVKVEGLTPEHLAYVMYTSGSTGRPKGVMVAHRAIVRLVVDNGYAAFGADDRVAFAANPAFDASTMEVWAPLVNGGSIVVIGQDTLLEPQAMGRALQGEGVTALFITTAVFNRYAEAIPGALAGLRFLLTGGEACDPASFARVLGEGGSGTVIHCYGPTETTTFAITHEVRHVAEGARGIPLGGPIGNTRVYLLDRAGEPVPVGVAGELYIGGVGVARGYQGRPALTAERFVPDPWGEAGARLYRTGDLGRWLSGGTIEFLGRTDHQVKVRGFRIEPGEIEARLLEHPGVREAMVLVREDTPGEKRLVAYVAGDETAGAELLRAHLGERLPAYMVPAAYVRLDALPLNANGKVDRRALPAPEDDAFARRGYEAPLGPAEEALAEIWAEVLGIEQVGRGDNFFDLGGHSLLAVQVTSRVRQVLEVEVALGELFTRPILADFARELETAARAELPPIEPASREGRLPLSFAQQRLWFLEQLGTLGSTYQIPMRMRLRGDLDRTALVHALDTIVARHEALRTVFTQVDGVPEQRIAPAGIGFRLVEHDLAGQAGAEAELRRLMAAELGAPFDLSRGPLIRGRLVRLAADDHVLLLTMHHIVSDGWSSGVLAEELSALYGAFHRGEPDPLPALPVQHADYALWQRRWVEGEVLRAQADHWKQTLAGAPELLELPTDRPRPAQMDHAGAQLRVELDEALTAGLKALSRRHGTTLFMTLLAGWAVVLGRLSGQDDVVIGTPTAGRGRREIEGLIGFFVNTLAVRVDLSDAPTAAELLGRVKKRALAAQHHQDLPFEQVVELVDPVRSMAHHPLFQVMFTWQSAARGGSLELPGLKVSGVGGAGSPDLQAKFDLSLSMQVAGDRIVGNLVYATALFERATVERWAGYLRRVLEEMVADDGRRVERLALLPPEERSRVVDAWNRTEAAYPGESCVHELFEAQVARTPHAAALVHEEGGLTYTQLNACSNRLAHHLIARGVGPDVCVGLCLERGPEMIVALLAVLKAGGAYVPLDPEYPGDRLRYMLADAAPAVLLTQASLAELFAGVEVPRIRVDADAAEWARASEENPERGALTPEHLAYVIYTSGSTGRPKGVMNQHRALVNRLAWGGRAWGMDADEALLCKTSLNFDGSVREILLPLMAGGRVVIARAGGHRDPFYLLEVIGRERITTVNLVPSLLQVLLDAPGVQSLRGLRRVLCGGEALPGALLERFRAALPGVELHNLYGPSEAATAVTWPRCAAEPGRAAVPIGGPSANARAYVLDGVGEPVPAGVAGELYIGGVPVARGYRNRAALTAERFVPDPFGGEPGARLYRTGDVVRWLADGRLEFVGRNDDQVKVRGFRVELGEIEARLREHAGVRETVVLVREDVPGDRRLVAYYVAGADVEVEALRAHLAGRLPEYMVPAAYVRMEALPLTPSGKLDRRALPAPEGEAYASREYEPPVNETEEVLAGIWAEVLRVERVGRRDNFFELGGHSLLAVQVVSRVRQALGVALPLGELFTRPVLQDLAQEVVDAQLAQFDPDEIAELAALLGEPAFA